MPLKNPKELPKIPKTRKKKAHAAIEAVPEKKPDKQEYVCKAFFYYDPSVKKQFTVFRIETVSEFSSFAYEVAVDLVKEKHEFFFVLMGLKALPNAVPEIQPAKADMLFEDLVGEYTVSLVKQDGAINSARLKINPFLKEIELLEEFKPKKKNNRLFSSFLVSKDLFTFGN